MNLMKETDLLALTPLDGRYAGVTEPLRAYFSEFAYLRGRTQLEIRYLIALCLRCGTGPTD
jgi:adenylosuccinate lyase